ncbi:MAG: putative sulfate exporter family transporter [Pseudomonadales bacterium]|jgi:uncharacterized integral membrane protein (TIGR00698 family)|nr:putative sulfate exporter family transporter [Pseudomonadales bacterium]
MSSRRGRARGAVRREDRRLSEPGITAAARRGATGWLATAALLIPLGAWGNPAVALLVGAAVTLALDRPLVEGSGRYGTLLLQSAIVLLGFRLSIDQVLAVSGDALPLVAGYVVGALALGLALGRLLGLERISTILLSAGTAICGGTAMATLAPIICARSDQLGIAVGIVFLLNALALFTFPALGAWLGMSQETFGVFVALAVHDTSSVVATAASYGDRALEVATTVKLGRTLWLIPLAIATSVLVAHARARVRVPGFILAFVAASLCASLLDLPTGLLEVAGHGSRLLLVAALFFVGLEFRRSTVSAFRGRVLAHALMLWALASTGTLTALRLMGVA